MDRCLRERKEVLKIRRAIDMYILVVAFASSLTYDMDFHAALHGIITQHSGVIGEQSNITPFGP
jgi:hypothetical protein